VIEDVMPGEASVSRPGSFPFMGKLSLISLNAIEVAPRQTVKVEIGGQGRPVAGEVTLPSGMARKLDLAPGDGSLSVKGPEMPQPEGFMSWDQQKRYAHSRQWYLSPAGKAARRARRSYGFSIKSDGSFRADDVVPGTYELNISIQNTLRFWGQPGEARIQGHCKQTVEVKPIPSGRSDASLDVGTLELKVEVNGQHQVAVGEAAPDFNIKTLDGKPLRLADLKGKFVLLDFWATWCGPCLEQEPHLLAAYDSFGNDDRFAIVSLSLDEKTESPRDHVTKHGLKWLQGFLGQGSSVTEQYGVSSIPQILLVGPDGKVVAKDLGGPGIKAAVSQALGRRL